MLLGHRYYDSSTGRFLTRDPVKDGRNWYVYCDGNPATEIDPAGLWSWSQYFDDMEEFVIGVGSGIWGSVKSPFVMGYSLLDGGWKDPHFQAKNAIGALTDIWDKLKRAYDGDSGAAGQLFGEGASAIVTAKVASFTKIWKYETGGGGIVFRPGGKRAGSIDWHAWGDSPQPWYKKFHYHRRPGIGKHRPWEGGK